MRALLTRSTARRGVVQGRDFRFVAGHPWPALDDMGWTLCRDTFTASRKLRNSSWVSMSDDIAKWQKWVDVAFQDCANLMLSRDMFHDLHRMVEKNPKMQQADYLYEYLANTYVAHASMMLRKHAKVSRDSISLARLATEMLRHHDRLPGLAADDGFVVVVDHFRQNAAKVESFADRVVAHSDPRPPNHVPTYDEVDNAIDAMDSLVTQCWLAIRGSYMQTCRPTVQYGWLQVFRAMGIDT